VRARFLGRKGSVSSRLRAIGELPQSDRKAAGDALNRAAKRIEDEAAERERALERESASVALRARELDPTLPGVAPTHGALHPVTKVERDMAEFFAGLGFSIEDGPEVESEWHNFDALRIEADHPSRDSQDTFWVSGGHVLRTHTSPVQIRTMTGRQPPFRFIAPGRVYRCDFDATHSPFFHQIEGFMVDERVTFGDMKGVLYAFARHLMGPDIPLRFRAHFFPFTEPSAEFDFSWQGGWLEWGGCGMIHPSVLENCGIDSTRWQGFAFGMPIDRTAMQRFGIPNIHRMFDGDVRVLEPLA
jgi:phenylalanyl-tRNA synthetase alpha chain